MNKLSARTLSFQPGERNIFFHILTACNLSCRHCYINPEQHGKETLTLQTMENWLQLFFKAGKENNLIFLGGEPTMHPDLAATIKIAGHIGYQSITVDSNGYLFHDLLDNITPEDAVLSFSLDGPSPEVNDPIRGKGVFDICTANIKKAVQKGFRTSLIYTVSGHNIDHLYRMPALLEKWGVNRFFIQIIGIRGKVADDKTTDLQLTPEEWLSTVPGVAMEAARRSIEVIFPKVFLTKDEPFQCAGQVAENFFIFPNGRVYQCPLCEDFPINTFQIEDNHLVRRQGLVEEKLFTLNIPEGCVMNKLLQPGNICYDKNGRPLHRISCCLLKQKMVAHEGPAR